MSFVDDRDNIPDKYYLLRRVPPVHFVPDENLGCIRPSSAAFENDKNGDPMSVRVQELLFELGHDLESVLQGHEGFALARLEAQFVRTLGQIIALDEVPAEPAHGLVVGDKKKSCRRKMSKHATWAIEPSTESES